MIKINFSCDLCQESKEINISFPLICSLCDGSKEKNKYASVKDIKSFLKSFFNEIGFFTRFILLEQINPVVFYVELLYGKTICRTIDLEVSLSKNTISFIKDGYKLSLPRRVLAKPFYSDLNKSHFGFTYASIIVSHFILSGFKIANGLTKPHNAIRIKETEHDRIYQFRKLKELIELLLEYEKRREIEELFL